MEERYKIKLSDIAFDNQGGVSIGKTYYVEVNGREIICRPLERKAFQLKTYETQIIDGVEKVVLNGDNKDFETEVDEFCGMTGMGAKLKAVINN